MPASKIATVEQLVAAGVAASETFTVPGAGLTVKLRSLTRGEVRSLDGLGSEEANVRGLMLGLDEPRVTEEQARAMFADDQSVRVTLPILMRILEVSGLREGFPAG